MCKMATEIPCACTREPRSVEQALKGMVERTPARVGMLPINVSRHTDGRHVSWKVQFYVKEESGLPFPTDFQNIDSIVEFCKDGRQFYNRAKTLVPLYGAMEMKGVGQRHALGVETDEGRTIINQHQFNELSPEERLQCLKVGAYYRKKTPGYKPYPVAFYFTSCERCYRFQ